MNELYNEYAAGLYLLAQEEHAEQRWLEQLTGLLALLEEQPQYVRLLDAPMVETSERLALAEQAFGAYVDAPVLHLIQLLASRRRMGLFAKCVRQYGALYDTQFGIERAEAVTAAPMTDTQVQALTKKLSQITGKTVVLQNRVDKSCLGGVVLRMNDTQIDGSVKNGLEKLKRQLLSAEGLVNHAVQG